MGTERHCLYNPLSQIASSAPPEASVRALKTKALNPQPLDPKPLHPRPKMSGSRVFSTLWTCPSAWRPFKSSPQALTLRPPVHRLYIINATKNNTSNDGNNNKNGSKRNTSNNSTNGNHKNNGTSNDSTNFDSNNNVITIPLIIIMVISTSY